MIRVNESMQKAAQIGGQIRDDQHKNSHIAQFLSFLFSQITSDDVRAMSVDLFSELAENGVDKNLKLHEMIAIFLPLYASKAHDLKMDTIYPDIHFDIPTDQASYLGYLNAVAKVLPLYQQLDKDTLVSLIITLLEYHRLFVMPEHNDMNQVRQTIRAALVF